MLIVNTDSIRLVIILAAFQYGNHNHWTNVLINISGMIRPDIGYIIMMLVDYNSSQTAIKFQALYYRI